MSRWSLTLLPVLLFGAALAASCSDDSDAADTSESGTLAALSIIDAVGFHEIDDGLNESPEQEIDPEWLGKVLHSQIAVASLTWPQPLQDEATTFIDAAERLVAALDADDPAQAAPAAKEAHEGQHELSTQGWAYLGEQAGIKTPAEEEGAVQPSATSAGG